MKHRTALILLFAFLLVVPKTTLYGETFDEIFIRGAKLHYQRHIIETRGNDLEWWEAFAYHYFQGFVSGQDNAYSRLFILNYPCMGLGNGEMWDLVAIYTINHPDEKEAFLLFEKAVLERDPGFQDKMSAVYRLNLTK